MAPIDTQVDNIALQHVIQVHNDVQRTAYAIQNRLGEKPVSEAFPESPTANQLKLAAHFITNEVPVAVIKVSQSGFDTHSNQLNKQNQLLAQLAQALAAFITELQRKGKWHKVLLMTYSEFGRRAAENGSKGTDHGTAATHFLLGGNVKGGFYGQQPSLTDLSAQNLRHTLDFHSLYRDIAENWWHLPDSGFSAKLLNCVT